MEGGQQLQEPFQPPQTEHKVGGLLEQYGSSMKSARMILAGSEGVVSGQKWITNELRLCPRYLLM